MAKSKNKKKNGAASMEISTETSMDLPQAMDMSETTTTNPALGVINRKIKKGVPMRRSKNLKKLKAMERAICQSEKSNEKISKNKSKQTRVHSAKSLYD